MSCDPRPLRCARAVLRWAGALLAAGAAVAADPAGDPAGDQFCAARGVTVEDGAIRLARQWQTLFREGFESAAGEAPPGWAISNFEGRLAITVDAAGETGNGLVVANRGTKGDTAFEVSAGPIPVRAADEFRFEYSWRASFSPARLSGHKGLYESQLQWVDAGGAVLSATPLPLARAGAGWQRGCVTGKVPPGAAAVRIRFGWDHPNVDPGHWVALDDLVLEGRSAGAPFEPSGEIVSRPLRIEGADRLGWEAETPAGTRLELRVAGAPDVGGVPGPWSEFLGPDGSPQSAFTAPGPLPQAHAGRPWLRYAVRWATDIPDRTPVLRRVSLGPAREGPWAGRDEAPPVVFERTPGRTGDPAAPIGFRIGDKTGLDPSSLRFLLDGEDVTAALTREGDRFTYVPPRPLGPPAPRIALSGWRVTNYRNALVIEALPPRVPGAEPGLRITRSGGETDTAFRVESPVLPVQGGAGYSLSWWARSSLDLTGAGSQSLPAAGEVQWVTAEGRGAGERVLLELGQTGGDWRRYTVEATAPPGADGVRIAFGFDQPNLFDGAALDLAEVSLEGPRPDRPPSGPNLHRLRLEAADWAGNRLDTTWHLLIRPPRTAGIVSLREDGAVLIDGAPFFPIGLYAVWKKPFNDNSFDKAFRDLRAAGFNLAHTYSSGRGKDFEEFYAAAARHGVRLFVASGAGANCTDVETVLADVVREEGEAALLAWYLADDTASHVGSAELRAVSEAIHDVDPAHLTVQADGVGAPPSSRYRDYVDATDGFLPELYPVRRGSAGVPQIIADMKTVAGDLAAAGTRRKSIWAIVQYFQGWGWDRYPTQAELRAMSYLAIIHGANGITWYTYGGWGDNHGVTDTPETWAAICAVAGEIARLQEALVEPSPEQPPPPQVLTGPPLDALGQPSISVLLKEHAGRRWLLAANSAEAAVTCRMGGVPSGPVEVLFEDRAALGAGADGLTDTFGPYAVHVYAWGP